AEIFNSIIPLFNEIGVKVEWRVLHGTPDFFNITKKFHNTLQGEDSAFTDRELKIYYETNRKFAVISHMVHDLVVIHDPQPAALISFYEKKQPWIFRCHIDLSNPNKQAWDYLKTFIQKYDHMIVSKEEYKRPDIKNQSIIRPAIDPLSLKNKDMSEESIEKFLKKRGIERNKPIITQVSRFDKWKNPFDVLRIFEQVRKKQDCQLVLAGSFASDDPEGQDMLEKVEAMVKTHPNKEDIHIVLGGSDTFINCLQRASAVVVQKSSREGFGLVVTEALYKGTPVVASNIGGIPLQVIDGKTGFLHDAADIDGFSESIIKLLNDEKLREELGKNAKEHVIKNFLTTRLMSDWLDIFAKFLA
ncbi:MAG: glycosyltransferase, partial [Nanoarchaeota archaeon]|nr:glycosyltransferase [Nanoarchaeota archaeon]